MFCPGPLLAERSGSKGSGLGADIFVRKGGNKSLSCPVKAGEVEVLPTTSSGGFKGRMVPWVVFEEV